MPTESEEADIAEDRASGFELPSVNSVVTLTGPTVLWFSVFLLVPLALIVVYSFLTYQSFNVIWEPSAAAWLNVFSGTSLRVFGRTIVVGLVVTFITLIFGYPLAYFLRFHLSLTAGILLLLFLVIPFWTNGLIRVIGWIPVLGRTGVINQFLLWTGLIDQPLSWLLFSPFSQIVGYLQNYVVFMAAPIYISLAQIDEDLLDASETLRGDPVATFRYVTWPLSLPGVAIGAMFVFVLSIGDLIVPQFLSGGESTVSSLIYLAVSTGLNYPSASALSISLLVVILVFITLLFRAVDISEITRGQ